MTTMTLRERAAQKARWRAAEWVAREDKEERELRRRMADAAVDVIQYRLGLEAVPNYETGTATVDGIAFMATNDGNSWVYLASQADWLPHKRVYIYDWESLDRAFNAPAPEPPAPPEPPYPTPPEPPYPTPPDVEDSLARIATALESVVEALQAACGPATATA